MNKPETGPARMRGRSAGEASTEEGIVNKRRRFKAKARRFHQRALAEYWRTGNDAAAESKHWARLRRIGHWYYEMMTA